jgi:UDP-N-acetylmuramate: L-alanyl-gamma-D-glutamyl-meso-diaminopimelate ligase
MKIHILAISGAMTTPLALALKSNGHTVTGSDQNHIYPPFSQILHRAHISINPKLNSISPDLVIVGSAYKKFKNTQAELSFFRNHKIPFISATQYLAANLVKKNSILVAGSYGKTTITAILAWILTKSGFNPSYFFGGQAINKFPSLKFTSSDWSVLEADESINGLDTQAKFLYYPVKYLVLTSSSWEHRDSYKSESENRLSFIKLIKRLPPNGLLVYNTQDPSVKPLIKNAHCQCVGYSLYTPKHPFLFGHYNQNNLAACFTLCTNLGISQESFKTNLRSFKGIKRRLELVSIIKNTYFYDDFAQSPRRVKESLLTLQKLHPGKIILVIFEAQASFLQYKSSIGKIADSFKPATKVFLGKLSFTSNLPKSVRTTSFDYKLHLGAKLNYLPICSDLQNLVLSSLKPGHILVHFSSGGLSGLKTFKNIIKNYKLKTKIQFSCPVTS